MSPLYHQAHSLSLFRCFSPSELSNQLASSAEIASTIPVQHRCQLLLQSLANLHPKRQPLTDITAVIALNNEWLRAHPVLHASVSAEIATLQLESGIENQISIHSDLTGLQSQQLSQWNASVCVTLCRLRIGLFLQALKSRSTVVYHKVLNTVPADLWEWLAVSEPPQVLRPAWLMRVDGEWSPAGEHFIPDQRRIVCRQNSHAINMGHTVQLLKRAEANSTSEHNLQHARRLLAIAETTTKLCS